MNSRQALKQFHCRLAMIAVAIALVAGCNQGSPGEPKTEVATKLPKMKFHRPNSFPVAVSRLVEIHQCVLSENLLPDPKIFQVRWNPLDVRSRRPLRCSRYWMVLARLPLQQFPCKF